MVTPGLPVPGHPGLRDVEGPAVQSWILQEDLTVHAKQGSLEGILNTRIFMNAWDYLDRDGRFRNYDWVVKVDPDAVFFPSRLREHLDAKAPHKKVNMYFMNCRFQDKLWMF